MSKVSGVKAGDSHVSRQKAAEALETVLSYTGVDITRFRNMGSIEKVLESVEFTCRGIKENSLKILDKHIEVEGHGPVNVLNISFLSFCEHHLMPFHGVCHLSYIPQSHGIGLGRIVNYVRHKAANFYIQEDLTRDLASDIQKSLNPLGVAVMMKAVHTCLIANNPGSNHSEFVTSSYTGAFEDDKTLQNNFLLAVNLSS